MTKIRELLLLVASVSLSRATLTIKDDSFKITGPSSYKFNFKAATEITFDITFVNSGDATNVADLKLFLSDKEDLSTTNKEVQVANKDAITGITFPFPMEDGNSGDDEKPQTGAKVKITIPVTPNCADLNKLCGQLDSAGDTKCIDITGKMDCQGLSVKASSFIITAPASYTFRLSQATEITFSIIFSNAGGASSVTDLELYLSDKEDFSDTEKEVKVGDKNNITGITFPVAVAAASGTPIAPGEKPETGAKTSVIIPSATNCADFNKFCGLLKPGDDVQCIDITGKTNCTAAPTSKPPTPTESGAQFNTCNFVLKNLLPLLTLVILLDRRCLM